MTVQLWREILKPPKKDGKAENDSAKRPQLRAEILEAKPYLPKEGFQAVLPLALAKRVADIINPRRDVSDV